VSANPHPVSLSHSLRRCSCPILARGSSYGVLTGPKPNHREAPHSAIFFETVAPRTHTNCRTALYDHHRSCPGGKLAASPPPPDQAVSAQCPPISTRLRRTPTDLRYQEQITRTVPTTHGRPSN